MKIKPNRPVHDPEFKAEHRLRFRLDSLRGPLNSRPYRNSAGYRVDGLTLKEKEITECPYPFRFVSGRVGGVRTQWSVSGELLSLTNVAKLGVGVETRVSYSVDNGEGDLFFDPNGIESPEAGPTQSVEPRLRFNLANWKNNEETPVETRDRRLVKITEVKDPILSFPVVGDIPGSGAGCFWTAGGVYSLNPDGASPADLFFVAKVPKVEETQGPVETREKFNLIKWINSGRPPVETRDGRKVVLLDGQISGCTYPVRGQIEPSKVVRYWTPQGTYDLSYPDSVNNLYFTPVKESMTFEKAVEVVGSLAKEREVAVKAVDPTNRRKFDILLWKSNEETPVVTKSGHEVVVEKIHNSLEPDVIAFPVLGSYFSSDGKDSRRGTWSAGGQFGIPSADGKHIPTPFPALDLYFRDIAND